MKLRARPARSARRWVPRCLMALACLAAFAATAGMAAPEAITPQVVTLESLLNEMVDLSRLGSVLTPPRTTTQSTSYDRASDPPCAAPDPCWFANRDAGHFIRLEEREGRTERVLLERQGPGAIEQIWSANPAGTLRIYLDGAESPALEAAMRDLLWGEVPPFVPPLAGGPTGKTLYFPIPYDVSCKVTTDRDPMVGRGLYYRISTRTYPPSVQVETFSMARVEALSARIAEVAASLASPGGAYIPSPSHERWIGNLTAGGAPLVLSPPVPASGGVIRQLWLRPHSPDDATLRETLLTIAFDNQVLVRAPLGDFFGTGPGLNPYESTPLSVRADGSLVALWPMPFQSSATVRLERDGTPGAPCAYEIVVEPRAWTHESLYFHAGWRADHVIRAHTPQDWNVISISGRGHIVGLLLNVANPLLDWWGEGDEKVYIDGDPFPTYFGTGTEDLFGFGWAEVRPWSHAYHNQTRAEGAVGRNFGRASLNRWFIPDPIAFEQAVGFDLEQHFITNSERRPLYDALICWYAAEGCTDNLPELTADGLAIPPVTPLVERPVPGLVMEAEDLEILSSTGALQNQNMQQWELGSQVWSGHYQLFWYDNQAGQELSLRAPLTEAGQYCVDLYPSLAPDYGMATVLLDGQVLVEGAVLRDPQGPRPGEPVALGSHTLAAGDHVLTVRALGPDPGSPHTHGNYVGLDALSLVRTEPALPLGLSVHAAVVSWAPRTGTAFDVVMGSLAALRQAGGDYGISGLSCLASATTELAAPALQLTAAGEGSWYLVRARHCGEGTYDSGGSGQAANRDAAIAAAPGRCP